MPNWKVALLLIGLISLAAVYHAVVWATAFSFLRSEFSQSSLIEAPVLPNNPVIISMEAALIRKHPVISKSKHTEVGYLQLFSVFMLRTM